MPYMKMKVYDLAFSLLHKLFSSKLKRDRIPKIFIVKTELKKTKQDGNHLIKYVLLGFFYLFNIQESERLLNLCCSVLLSISINIQDKCQSYYIEKLDSFLNVLLFCPSVKCVLVLQECCV